MSAEFSKPNVNMVKNIFVVIPLFVKTFTRRKKSIDIIIIALKEIKATDLIFSTNNNKRNENERGEKMK